MRICKFENEIARIHIPDFDETLPVSLVVSRDTWTDENGQRWVDNCFTLVKRNSDEYVASGRIIDAIAAQYGFIHSPMYA